MKADPFDDAALTRDAMLSGRVTVLQPRAGYRAGVDPVLLAAAVPAGPGDAVLELGCGAAPALCCLTARVGRLDLAGLEVQPGYADLARRNLALNGVAGTIHVGDVARPPAALRARSFDHVLMNPPYFEPGTRAPADDPGREVALAGPTPLEMWIATAAKRLKPRGTATVVLRVERLPTLMSALDRHLGALVLQPLLPRAGRAPRLVLMQARKDGRAPFRLLPGLILHDGDSHHADAEDYSPAVRAILHDAEPLPMTA